MPANVLVLSLAVLFAVLESDLGRRKVGLSERGRGAAPTVAAR